MSKSVRNCELMNTDHCIFIYMNTSPKYHKLPWNKSYLLTFSVSSGSNTPLYAE